MSALLIRGLILVGIFASVFLISQVVLGTVWRNRSLRAGINRRLTMIRQGAARLDVIAQLRKNAPSEFANLPPFVAARMRSFQRSLFASGLSFEIGQVLTAMAAGFVLVLAVLMFVARQSGFTFGIGVVFLLMTLAAAIAVALPAMVIGMIGKRRRRRIEQQFPVALDVFVRALRSGHPVASAIELLTNEMEDPIGSEFGLVSDEISYGAELTDALENMANRWNLEDMYMFVVSLSVQIETGGNLAEILENLADVIRARASMYMKVRALSSEGRMTGWMLTILPIVAFVGMFSVNPGFYLAVAGDPIFMIGFPVLLTVYLMGVLIIRRMVDLKV